MDKPIPARFARKRAGLPKSQGLGRIWKGELATMDSFPRRASPARFLLNDYVMSGLDWSGSMFCELVNGLVDSTERRLLIITGQSGAGKTIWCLELARQAADSGISVEGLISPAVFEHGSKVGIDLFDIVTKERKRLANRRPNLAANYTGRTWQLDFETLHWGNDLLAKIADCQLFVLDELGPMELVEGQGLTKGLDLIDARKFALACVVVRPSLLTNALARWPWAIALNSDEARP